MPRAIPESKRPEDIVTELRARSFDPSKSRAIVFAMRRKDTEKLARKLNSLAESDDEWNGRTRSFHAGMTTEERSAAYQSYRSGEAAILCATKAFGMGMDLPNIHHVFHFQPPFSLEDYIQEIGRAGRSSKARKEAGFNSNRPIRCVLYAEAADFSSLSGRLKDSRLSWGQISQIQSVLHDYAKRLGYFKADPDAAIPVPTNLLARQDAFQDEYAPSTLQRTGFHWLERLGRIRQEYYVPAHLELENKDPDADRAATDALQKLCVYVEDLRQNTDPDRERILANTGVLFKILEVSSSAALFEHLRQAQESGHIRVYRTLSVRCTKKRADIIKGAAVKNSQLPPHIEIAFDLADSIVRALSYDQFLQIASQWFRDEVQNRAGDTLNPSSWTWLEGDDKRKELYDEVVKDLQQGSRARAVLFLVREAPNVQFQNTLEGEEEVFEFRLDSKRGGDTRQRQFLRERKKLARRVLTLIYEKQTSAAPIDLIPTLQELGVQGQSDIKAFEQVLLFLVRMGFIRVDGGLLPMALETYLISKEPLDISDQESDDFKIYEDFQQSGRLKELRLVALRVLATLEDADVQNRFIKQYLESRSAGEVFSLLDKTLTETEAAPELLSALREEALKEEVERLSPEQQAVYEAPLNESTLVSAGPGSGKTHTLLLRLARLIHEENVSPSQILVLAYNRAVVTEVRARLRELMKTLGYRDLSRRLRVFTFHGLIRYVLTDEVNTDDLNEENGDPWVEKFNTFTDEKPGRIGMHLSPGTIRYIFVDEYQDITEGRYRMLKWIAGDSSHVTVIGDPDQSIYGYQRANNGQPRSAMPFFERFRADFDATEYQMNGNFRSLPDIVEEADQFIRLNEDRPNQDALDPQRNVPADWDFSGAYVEVHDHKKLEWLDRLPDLLHQKGPDGKRPRDVAVLFRSNAEVYRGYRAIQNQLGVQLRSDGIPLVIQGTKRNWMRVREVAHCIEQIQKHQEDSTEPKLFSVDDLVWETLIEPDGQSLPASWDDYTLHLVQCVIEQFEEEQTDNFRLDSLIEHLHHTFHGDKGEIYKLLQIHQERSRQEGERTPNLVLSNLHKVKGLEYDVVVMPASFQPLPFEPNIRANASTEDIAGMIEEERRAYYVGMTRARNRLIRYEWRREKCLQKGSKFDRRGKAREQLGVPLDADAFAGHVAISRCANKRFLQTTGGFETCQEYLRYMSTDVQSGDPLTLQQSGRKWYVQHGEVIIAQLSRHISARLNGASSQYGDLNAHGAVVSDVVRYTYEDAKEYDKRNNTNYSQYWSDPFIENGYTYIVNFAGFAQVN